MSHSLLFNSSKFNTGSCNKNATSRFFFSKYLQDIARYKLGSPKSFHYLNQSTCYELDGVNGAHEYLATRRAMDIVGISEQEQVCIFGIPDHAYS